MGCGLADELDSVVVAIVASPSHGLASALETAIMANLDYVVEALNRSKLEHCEMRPMPDAGDMQPTSYSAPCSSCRIELSRQRDKVYAGGFNFENCVVSLNIG